MNPADRQGFSEWCETPLGKAWQRINAGRGLTPVAMLPDDRTDMSRHVGSRTFLPPPLPGERGYPSFLMEIVQQDPDSILVRDALRAGGVLTHDPWVPLRSRALT